MVLKEFVSSLLKKIRNRKFLYLLMACFSLALFSLFFIFVASNGFDRKIVLLDKKWKITDSDSTYESMDVRDYKVPANIEIGSRIVFENILDSAIAPRSTLKFRSYHSLVSVYLDDECLYRFGESLQKGELVGSGFHYVNLPQDVVGKKLKIVFDVRERAAANTRLTVEILPRNAVSDYSARHAISLCSGVFLGIFGALLVCFGFLALMYKRNFVQLIFIGLFAFLMGVWTLCYTKTIQAFSVNFALNTNLEYVSLYLGPIVFEYLLLLMFANHIEKWKRVGLNVCLALGLVFFGVTTVMHILNVLHYPQTLLFFHVYILASFVYIFIFKILFNRRAGLQEKIITAGLSLFLLFAVFDLFRYNLLKYFGLFEKYLNVTVLPVGTLLLIFSLVASFLVYVYGMVVDKSEKDMLAQLAYRDVLTGLYNRAKCEQIFDVLDEKDLEYAVISLDLNGLKSVNDTYGHNSGDKFISSFADVLKKSFDGIGTSIRIGGDEFVVIVRAEHLRDLPFALSQLEKFEKKSSVNLPVLLDASYGFACRKKGEASRAKDVYRMADEKMYEMKAASKKARV